MSDRLNPGQSLALGNRLVAKKFVTLRLNNDGNLVLRKGQVLWDTKTAGQPVSRATMRQDGNFVLEPGIWDTSTDGNPRAILVVLPTGYVVILAENGTQVWAEP